MVRLMGTVSNRMAEFTPFMMLTSVVSNPFLASRWRCGAFFGLGGAAFPRVSQPLRRVEDQLLHLRKRYGSPLPLPLST